MFSSSSQPTDSSYLLLYPLANNSFFLLLILSFNSSKDHNVYRKALLNCKPGKTSGGG